MTANSYPGVLNDDVPALWCVKPQALSGDRTPGSAEYLYTLSSGFIDDILNRLEKNSAWMTQSDQSFQPIKTYASGPLYAPTGNQLIGPSLEPTGKTVNYLGCAEKISIMAVSAIHTPDNSLYMSIGQDAEDFDKSPMLKDFAPMHELIHVYQGNTAPFKQAKYSTGDVSLSWVSEGTADAVALLRLEALYRGHGGVMRIAGPYTNRFYRRFYKLRNYNIPLNFRPDKVEFQNFSERRLAYGIPNKMWAQLGYETNGFWYHIVERYLEKDGGKLTGLFGRMTSSGIKKMTWNVDAYLDQHDGAAMDGLEHVYPQFLAEFTNWWDYRTAGRITEQKWLSIAFNGCEIFDLSATKTKLTKPLEISDYAGKCVDLKVDKAAAKRLNDIQLLVAGADQGADEIYIGVSRVKGSKRGETTCYDIVEQRGVRTAPCLIDPHQGFANWQGGAKEPKRTLVRTFNLTDLQADSGQDVMIRFVVVRVPAKHYDVMGLFKRKTLDLTVSLDLASLKSKSNSPSKKRSVMNYGARQGEGPVAPDGSTSVMNATLEDALRGNLNRMGAPGAGAMMKRMIGFELLDENETNFSVGLLLSQPLKEGVTGPVDVTGVMGERTLDGKQVVSIQNPRKESTLDILEYDEATLRVKGEVNVCAAPLPKLMSEETSDLCRAGEELSFEVEGAVAFPNLVDGETEFTLHRTEGYDAYKDLRMERLAQRGLSFGPGSGGPTGPAPPPISPSGCPGDNLGDNPPLCLILDDGQRCSCTCENKACFDQKSAANNLRPQEQACRLTCGKKWNTCTP
ncbi:MAG: hypothetical protein AAGH90_11270 [Pseudomonadota bacterium]